MPGITYQGITHHIPYIARPTGDLRFLCMEINQADLCAWTDGIKLNRWIRHF